jgi:CheY-like chemotaxis protein
MIVSAVRINPESRPSGSQKPRILLVNPDIAQAQVIRLSLYGSNYDVDMVHTVKDALDYFMPGKYRGLICDTELKGNVNSIDGLSLMKLLKEKERTLDIFATNYEFKQLSQVNALTKIGAVMYTKKEHSKETGEDLVKLVMEKIPPPADPDSGPFLGISSDVVDPTKIE